MSSQITSYHSREYSWDYYLFNEDNSHSSHQLNNQSPNYSPNYSSSNSSNLSQASVSSVTSRASSVSSITPQTMENKYIFDESGLNIVRANHTSHSSHVNHTSNHTSPTSYANYSNHTKNKSIINTNNLPIGQKILRMANVSHATNVSNCNNNNGNNFGMSDQSAVFPNVVKHKTAFNVPHVQYYGKMQVVQTSQMKQTQQVTQQVTQQLAPQVTQQVPSQRAQIKQPKQGVHGVERVSTKHGHSSNNSNISNTVDERKDKICKTKLTREKIDTNVADSLHKYGLDLSPTKKVEDLTLFENTLYQNALWKQMIYDPDSFKDLRGKLNRKP